MKEENPKRRQATTEMTGNFRATNKDSIFKWQCIKNVKERLMASQYPRSTPIIGNWYQSTEQNLYFEVVAVDGLSNSIEVQLLDGEIMEFDTDSWHEAVITSAQPPEDASAAYEMSSEDLRMNDYIT